MPKFKTSQSSFVGGRLSPKVYGRTDLAQYGAGAKELKNFLVQSQGGITKRAGTEFVMDATRSGESDASLSFVLDTQWEKCRLIPFVFSQNESYVIQIYPYSSGNVFRFYNLSDKYIFNVRTINSTLVSSNTHTIGNGAAWDITESELQEIQFAQAGDVLIICHPNHRPLGIRRVAVNVFEVVEFQNAFNTTNTNYYKRVPYRFQNTNTSHTLASSVTTLNATGTLTSSLAFFDETHVGAYFKINQTAGPTTGVVLVTSVVSSTVANIRVIKAVNSTGAEADWEESSWSDFRGWPRTVAIHNNRLVFGGNKAEPDTMWFSEVGDFSEFMDRKEIDSGAATPAVTDPFDLSISSQQIDEIQWINPGKNLTVGTKSAEFIVLAPDGTEVLSSTNFDISLETAQGSEYVQSVRIGNGLVFLARGGKSVREFRFNFDEDRFRADFIGALAEDLPVVTANARASFESPKVIEMQLQKAPQNIIWCIDNNGGLFAVTRDSSLGIIAWHRHVLAGSLNAEIPKVLSMAIVPSEDSEDDVVYLLVERTINDDTVYYIERLLNPYELDELNNDETSILKKPVYSDSSTLSIASSARTTFGGLSHLVGESVSVYQDGSASTNKTVQAGTNLISNPSAEVDTAGWEVYNDVVSITALNATANTVTVASGLNIREDQLFRYVASSSDIGGLVTGTQYYVNSYNSASGVLTLKAEKPLPSIDLTGALPGGTHELFPVYEALDGTGGTTTGLSLSQDLSGIFSPGSLTAIQFNIASGTQSQSKGFSYAFSINPEDQGKRIKVALRSRQNPATASFVYNIYDVTNNVMLPFEGFKVQNNSYPRVYDKNQIASDVAVQEISGDLSNVFVDFFTASTNSTQYRLIIHAYATGTTAVTYRVTDVDISSTGYIELDTEATEVIAGLQYESLLKTLDIDAGSAIGSSQGTRKRIDEITLRFDRTVGGSVGRSEDKLDEIVFREQAASPVDPIPLFTGDKVIEFRGDSNRVAEVVFKHNLPLPCTLLAYYARGTTND